MDTKYPYCNPEVWGGIECSINRVGHEYFDQFHFSGFYERKDLLRRVADLGITSLRLPILWEKHVKEQDADIDWTFAEECLTVLRDRNIEPIAGLIHHGSGPAFTCLEDSKFPELLASYALRVATRFPDIQYYTPINEPLTTARFSGLYGFWFPHGTGDSRFLRMLINQVKGIVLSMRSIRTINPLAKLVQTEDLSKIFSTSTIQYQASFENERRWLTNDLLCGRVNHQHPLFNYILTNGVSEEELAFFIENTCPPDIMGFNYYITSERFLDEHTDRYPPQLLGGNNIDSYVDTEAIRVPHDNQSGLRHLLTEAWDRFGIELALTEVQLHCTREEQLRWFSQAFDTCSDLCKHGIPVRAVTAWSILGAYGWNNLLRSKPEHYEPGVIDLRIEENYETQLARLIRSLATDQEFHHPLLKQKGWWERDMRFHHAFNHLAQNEGFSGDNYPLFIVGKTGTLGVAFSRLCELRNIPHRNLSRFEFDLSDPVQMESVINKYRPWAIINCAGYVRVDEAENDIINCMMANTAGPVYLAELSKRFGIRLLNFSSDLVFDGAAAEPYSESSVVSPLNVYGQSKADMEEIVLDILPKSLVVRTSAFFGPWDKYNFPRAVIGSLVNGRQFRAAHDLVVSPTYVPDLVNAALDLLIDEADGIWHLSNQEPVSWYDWAVLVAKRARLDSGLVIPLSSTQLAFPAKRPSYIPLRSVRGNLMPSFDHAIDRFMHEVDLSQYKEPSIVHP